MEDQHREKAGDEAEDQRLQQRHGPVPFSMI
jgi:hypothetical protein